MIENIVENCYNVHIAVSTANIDAKELGIMRFTIRGKNIEVTEGLRSAVTEKLGKLEKYFTPETEIIVTLRRGKRQTENRSNHSGKRKYHPLRAGKQ